MDPLARRVLARFVGATSGQTDKKEVPVVHQPSGRIVYVLPETLKKDPSTYKRIAPEQDRDHRPTKPKQPAMPRRPDRSPPPRDPHPRLPPYPAVPKPQDPPAATKPLKRPKPLKPQKVPEPTEPRKRVVIPNKPKTPKEAALILRVASRYVAVS